jgi:hypothetical protein
MFFCDAKKKLFVCRAALSSLFLPLRLKDTKKFFVKLRDLVV